jgi:hypothetical protein
MGDVIVEACQNLNRVKKLLLKQTTGRVIATGVENVLVVDKVEEKRNGLPTNLFMQGLTSDVALEVIVAANARADEGAQQEFIDLALVENPMGAEGCLLRSCSQRLLWRGVSKLQTVAKRALPSAGQILETSW